MRCALLVLARLGLPTNALRRTATPTIFPHAAISHNHLGTHPYHWSSGDPLLGPGGASFDSLAVKDPSVVFYSGSWHLFYTARDTTEYTMGYVRASTLDGLANATRFKLGRLHGRASPYGCAPQVFFFEPHSRWYLVYQTKDVPSSRYQLYAPMFSTNPDIENASGWSDPMPLLAKDSLSKWIDFWVICDDERAYLFYTQDQDQVMVRSTPIQSFPSGWSNAKLAVDNLHEAAHIYKVRGRTQFHMIYEIKQQGLRRFGLACANKLSGPWRKVTDHYAEASQLLFAQGVVPWTEIVSHGEAIRSGINQRLEYEPDSAQWLIQGMRNKDDGVQPYDDLRWNLGLINMTSPFRSAAARRSPMQPQPASPNARPPGHV